MNFTNKLKLLAYFTEYPYPRITIKHYVMNYLWVLVNIFGVTLNLKTKMRIILPHRFSPHSLYICLQMIVIFTELRYQYHE
jgi:hypothetical protein